MTKMNVEQIDQMRRNGDISWDDYARLLKGHIEVVRDFPSKRDREGRLRELEDLGGFERYSKGEKDS